MSTARDAAALAIATDLLTDAPAPLAWSNLGDWTATTDYDTACRQLALRVGRAAALAPDDHVLDLACGHGASLALWPSAFGVRRMSALEFQGACVARIRAVAPPGLETIVQGRFDALPLPAPLAAARFDAVLCVDAAYHARSLDAFAALAAQCLVPGGRLAFTTLLRPSAPAQASPSPTAPLSRLRPSRLPQERLRGTALRLALARAGIPAVSVVDADALATTLTRAGFTDIRLEPLDAVLAGFAAFVARRGRALPLRQRARPGWWKIRATGWLCDALARSGALHYVLVSAHRTGPALKQGPA